MKLNLNLKSTKAFTYFLMGSVAATTMSCKDDNDDNTPQVQSQIFVSSNTAMAVKTYDAVDANNISSKTYNVAYADADGIAYDNVLNRIIQFDRSNKQLVAFNNASNIADGETLTPSFSLSTAVGNGREITLSGSTLVVADDQDDAEVSNKLHVFSVGNDNFSVDKVYETEFNLWGIQLVGNTLYAIVDNTDQLAIFYNFGTAAPGTLRADKTISIEGIIRTHGIQYVASKDMMLLTDVGSGAIDNDGAIRIISSFSTKLGNVANGGTLSLADQVNISGPLTALGNPVDIAYDMNNDRIYVAERKNLGGRVLGFDKPAANSSDAPDFSEIFAGSSAIFIQN